MVPQLASAFNFSQAIRMICSHLRICTSPGMQRWTWPSLPHGFRNRTGLSLRRLNSLGILEFWVPHISLVFPLNCSSCPGPFIRSCNSTQLTVDLPSALLISFFILLAPSSALESCSLVLKIAPSLILCALSSVMLFLFPFTSRCLWNRREKKSHFSKFSNKTGRT